MTRPATNFTSVRTIAHTIPLIAFSPISVNRSCDDTRKLVTHTQGKLSRRPTGTATKPQQQKYQTMPLSAAMRAFYIVNAAEAGIYSGDAA